uniref:GAG-pre-integrase domain-containing protein n=1 Tax=Brassica oleracea var. oleracea TaxID=109376 RepID=A0A0D3ADU8_BRAOL
MARGRKEGSLYVIQAKLCKEEVNVASADMEIWHRRLGHMSEKGLNILSRKKLLPDMKCTYFSPCHDCLAGKQHRVAF